MTLDTDAATASTGRTDAASARSRHRMGAARALVLVAMGMLAAGLVLLATRQGTVTTPDSAVYVGVARSIAAGHGLYSPIHMYPLGQVDIGTPPPGSAAPAPTPLVIESPLEPILLSAGGHPIGAARIEDAVFFGVAVLLIGIIVLGVTGLLWLAAGAQLVVAFALADTQVSGVGTEAAALCLTVAAFGAVAGYLQRPRLSWVVLAALAMGLATLVRFAAGGLVIWGVIVMWRRRRDALALAGLGLAPLVAWFAYEQATGRSTGHVLGFHVVTNSGRSAARSVANWLLPADSPTALAGLAVVVVVVTMFVLVRRSRVPAARAFALFAVVQVVVLLAAITFVDAGVGLEPREFIPMFVALVLAGACALAHARLAKPVVVAVVVATMLRCGVDLASNTPSGYLASNWVHSPVMAQVRSLPAREVIYSNAPDAIYLLTGRATSSLPETIDYSTLQANQRLGDQMNEVHRTLATRDGVVVYIRCPQALQPRCGDSTGLPRSYLPSEAEVRRTLDLRPVIQLPDGTVYQLATQGAGSPR